MHGSIQKRVGKRGGVTWTAVVDCPPDPVTGRRRQKRLSAPTKRELERRVAEHIQAVARGTYADPGRLTVADFLTRWLASLDGVAPATRRRYHDLLHRHVLPALGSRPLGQLTPLDLQALYAARQAAGLAPTTVHLLHNVLHRALEQAVRWDLLARNPASRVQAPRPRPVAPRAWDAAQAAAFLRAAAQTPEAALWLLALTTGMRRSELPGLRWEDVDLEHGTLSVRHARKRGAGGGWELGPPKTRRSRRQLALGPAVVAALRQHRARQAAARLAAGPAWADTGYVFTGPAGQPLHPNALQARYRRLVAAAGVPYLPLHGLRHTYATLALASGEHPKIVQERLGHSSISMTLDRYSHVTPSLQRAAAERFEALLAQAHAQAAGARVTTP
jgi:integrase